MRIDIARPIERTTVGAPRIDAAKREIAGNEAEPKDTRVIAQPVPSAPAKPMSQAPNVACAAIGGPIGAATKVASQHVQVWLTTMDQKNLLTRKKDINLDTPAPTGMSAVRTPYQIQVDADKKYQQMDGFGASITDASASLIQRRMSDKQRDALMKDLFGRDGIHVSMVRQPMGSCDYNINLFTYDNTPGDTDLSQFSIDQDKRFMLPTLKEALTVNPDLKVMASPWSAPGWMKTSGSIIGGSLDPKNYQVYGEYFAKFIEAYKEHGVHIYAVTPQNEPQYVPDNYPGMGMEADEQAAFIKQGLGPSLERHGLDTKIFVFDHNFGQYEYPLQVLSDPDAAKYVAGTAWHGYGGEEEDMSIVHDAHPDKGAWFTEHSGGEWVPGFHDAFLDQMKNAIRVPRNWGKSMIFWNLALDQEHGPSLLGDWSTCRGLVTVNSNTGEVTHNVDYVTMGHLSKFVEPGAYRIDSNTFKDDLENVAFQNPDGSRVVLVCNRSKDEKTFQVNEGDRSFGYTLPAESAVTFKWNATTDK